ncbi:TauD/TfdA family dioxygenase [Saccharothrix sp. AJ9571]|nr:TauD/TfdA family dioxygenase [Saccharothrix sp. AJ9571]
MTDKSEAMLLDGIELRQEQGSPPISEVAESPSSAELPSWIGVHRADLERALRQYGAVVVRGLDVRTAEALTAISEQLIETVTPDREAFARRRSLGGEVLSSLEWPPDQPMCMHHEQSYLLEVPRLLVLGCFRAPAQGGVTGLADASAVLAALPDRVVDRFERDGWLVTRSYNELVGISWQEAFGTQEREAAEEYLTANDITFEWQPDGGLRTSQRRSAIVEHPATGEPMWFNQIAFLNEWTLDPEVRDYLVLQFGELGLPFNSRYGDGAPIEPETVQAINDVYDALTLREPWRTGDVLLVDNIRMAHSREPYQGAREIGLVLGEPVRLTGRSARNRPRP